MRAKQSTTCEEAPPLRVGGNSSHPLSPSPSPTAVRTEHSARGFNVTSRNCSIGSDQRLHCCTQAVVTGKSRCRFDRNEQGPLYLSLATNAHPASDSNRELSLKREITLSDAAGFRWTGVNQRARYYVGQTTARKDHATPAPGIIRAVGAATTFEREQTHDDLSRVSGMSLNLEKDVEDGVRCWPRCAR